MNKNDGKSSYIATKHNFRLNIQLFAEEPNPGTEPVPPVTEPTNPPEENEPPTDRMFSRDEVTTIVKKRNERAVRNILKEFGLENKEQIKEYLDKITKANADLTELQGKYSDLDNKYKSQNREYLYLKNNIVPEKYGDLDKEFVDELTEEKLLEVLKNHPEFVKPKVVIPEKLGQTITQKPQMTDKERAEKYLHVKL